MINVRVWIRLITIEKCSPRADNRAGIIYFIIYLLCVEIVKRMKVKIRYKFEGERYKWVSTTKAK